VSIEDIGIQNTNAANVGAAYYDTCGTYISIKNVLLGGFKYGAVLDQSELVDLDLCEIGGQNNGGAAVWIVNGSTLTPGASPGFTNRISVKRCQINQYPTAYCILDDGGTAHVFEDNNYNGGLNGIQAKYTTPLEIRGGEFESAAGPCINITGSCITTLTGGQFSATAGHSAIQGSGGPGTLRVAGASFSGGGGTSAITGAANFAALVLTSYSNQTGAPVRDGSGGYVTIDLLDDNGVYFAGINADYLNPYGGLKVNGTKVIGPRQTGWTADTGTAEKGAHATYAAGATLTFTDPPTAAEMSALATRLAAVEAALQGATRGQKAIKDAAIVHGLIG
jgi:hypothetical protein